MTLPLLQGVHHLLPDRLAGRCGTTMTSDHMIIHASDSGTKKPTVGSPQPKLPPQPRPTPAPSSGRPLNESGGFLPKPTPPPGGGKKHNGNTK